MTKPLPRRHPLIALVPVMLLTFGVTTACGDTAASEDSGQALGASSSEALGPVQEATGDTVKIGYIETGQTSAVDTTDEDKAAAAVAEYANNHLGGLAGHRIEIVVCESKGTPAGAQECGSQFVRDGVVAVAGSSPGEPEGTIEQLNAGGIAFTANLMANATALAAKDVFVFGNPLSVFGTPAQYAKDNGLDRAALVVIDVPGSAGPTKTIAPLLFGNAGATADAVLVPPGTADMTPQIQAARGEDPKMWYVLGDPNFCSTAAKAFQTLAVTEPLLFDARCIGPDVANALPGLEKMKFVSSYSTDPSDPDWPLFEAVLGEYGGDLEVSGYSITAFQGVLSLIRAVNAAAPSEVTPASVITALQTAPAVPYPLGGGITLQCNGPVAALSPNICSTGGLIADAGADGTLKNFEAVDASELYTLPAQ
jgi:branched-chain amino acid transport system substrate-binding protein